VKGLKEWKINSVIADKEKIKTDEIIIANGSGCLLLPGWPVFIC
jgi:hypothetical protein